MRTITVTIKKNGAIVSDLEGFNGTCTGMANILKETFGNVTNEEKKFEMDNDQLVQQG